MADRALDRLLPRWDHREQHEVAVRAPRERVLRAVEETKWRDLPLCHALLMFGSFGTKRDKGREPFLTSMTAGGFTELHRDEHEVVIGAVVCIEEPKGPATLVAPVDEAFAAFDRPGHYKVALDFRVVDGRLTTETRVISTSEAARRRFARYWALIRLPSGLIRREWLHGIRRRAEE
ncbi:hypothetical protein [Streptomyces sp. NBC_01618]|uniref:hypothetical protein n=1 Tax=Streptomyces sp. NBC_01618 TaxID=2975900 RepID=UPI00386B3E0E|nr:hypothetical protein OH735_23300 [Streptomyces sp. NBC_01618]